MAPDQTDVIVIGSGVGGGTVARRLAENGVRVLLLERGTFVPREEANWSVQTVFFDKKYKARERWLDRAGKLFDPGVYYNVGGATKFYGAAMFRLRERDFQPLEHHAGLSPGWPFSYAELAPYYDEAEAMFGVHGDDRADRTAPRGRKAYPFPAVPSEPAIEKFAEAMRKQGLSPSPLPLAIDTRAGGKCILCKTCDGFPCKLGAKNDAESSMLAPALATGRVSLMEGVYARRLLLSGDRGRIGGVEVDHAGERKILYAALFVVACGAVNSSALLLRSADQGLANSSGVVGRNYMVHNQSALMGLSARHNHTVFQKTLALNDFYFGEDGFTYPMGQAQMLGKLQGGMLSANIPYLPRAAGDELARHSIDWLVLSEDLPDPNNRVTLDGGAIKLSVSLNNMVGHDRLVRRMKVVLQRGGYPIVLIKSLVAHATAHQCGTVRFGSNPAEAALDPFCRSFDHRNLFVVDASFLPSSAAVNPALTIAAQALRSADHMLATDLGAVPTRS
jgi:choline dehydrogenase-like flavoprotein